MREAGLRLLAPRSGQSILEIGFGTGHSIVELARMVGPSGRVHGIDLSERMCSLAAKLATEQGVAGQVRLTCGDAERLPYESASMDGVFMSFALELFDTPDIPVVLAECSRVLRVGGRLCVVAVSKEGKRGFAVMAFEWTHRHFPNLVDCRPIHVRRALEEAGFMIEHADVRHMWVPVEIVVGVRTR